LITTITASAIGRDDALHPSSFIPHPSSLILQQVGYDFWLGVLKRNGSNYRGMVCSFVTSAEY
jgi:hypothetical protein